MLPKSRDDAFVALKWNPRTLNVILADRNASDPFWDFQPYANRFSMRCVLAHLADWDPISLSRIHQIATIDRPELPPVDEAQLAVDQNYTGQDPLANLARWAKNRGHLLAEYAQIPLDVYQREGLRITHGWISVEDYPALIALHDAYHISQAVDYLDQWKRSNNSAIDAMVKVQV